MRLKKLVILGFKSFADKTSLLFDSGIVCIVGPNGCGKSNISDAFRWVFGEQSAKSMRGGKMPDVIFAGTNSRKPLNIAEVSLTLADVQGALHIDYEEITITRRLHRSGESEYLLNGNSVRLKDLQALFLDSGVGKNAFSIFEQGKLDQVISYTPAERRIIFEEAAGILRFLQRKKESLKRLEQTDLNLSRIGDIHREVESQIAILEKHAHKAWQFKENQAALEMFEKAGYVVKWQAIEKKNAEAIQKEEKNQERLEEALRKESSWRSESRQIKQLLEEHDRSLRSQSEQVLILRGQQEMEKRELGSIEQRLMEEGQRTKKLKLEFEELTLERQTRQKMAVELESKKKRVEDEWGDAEKEWKQQLEKIKLQDQQMASFRQALTDKQQAHLKCLHQSSQWQSDLKQSEVRLENLREREKSLLVRLEQMRQDEQQLGEKVQERKASLQQVSDLVDASKDRLEQYEEDLNLLVQKGEELRKELEMIKRSVMESKARQNVLVKMREEREGFSSGSKRLLKESENPDSQLYQLLTPLYECLTPEKEAAEAIAIVLRAYAETLVVKTEAEMVKVIAYAEEERLLDYSLICMEWLNSRNLLSKKPEYALDKKVAFNPLSIHLLQSIAVVSSQDEALKLWADGRCLGSWSSGGVFIDHLGVFFKLKPNDNQVFLRESELKDLEEELIIKEEQLDNLESLISGLQQRRSLLLAERAEVEKMLRRDEMKLVEGNFALQKASSDLEKNRADRRNGEIELAALTSKVRRDYQANLKALRSSILMFKGRFSFRKKRLEFKKRIEKQDLLLKSLQQDQKEKGAMLSAAN